jgi:hypothetical protein
VFTFTEFESIFADVKNILDGKTELDAALAVVKDSGIAQMPDESKHVDDPDGDNLPF